MDKMCIKGATRGLYRGLRRDCLCTAAVGPDDHAGSMTRLDFNISSSAEVEQKESYWPPPNALSEFPAKCLLRSANAGTRHVALVLPKSA